MTQHDKIIALCADGDWHCQTQFWLISKSPHKRRDDLVKRGYVFEERRCEHGIPLSKDFRLVGEPVKPKVVYVEVERDGQVIRQQQLI